ncbi:MAG: LysM peptidoglycan-binding domain-containing protein [Gammaproteobacteria bacterium]|nr:LysM peptidoglycan-binding domain-containing protein [Gammaproteobacteria bacterium]
MSVVLSFRRFAWCLVAGGMVVAGGCASVPPTQEMSDARQALDAAREADASRYAPRAMKGANQLLSQAEQKLEAGAFKQAQESALAAKQEASRARAMAAALGAAKTALREAAADGALSAEAQTLLQQAEVAASADDEKSTVRLAGEAKQRAEQDANNAWLAKAKASLDEANTFPVITPDQRAILELAEAAHRKGEGKKAHLLSDKLVGELRMARQAAQPAPSEPASPPVVEAVEAVEESPALLSSYTVERGDSLWKIAARQEVYGDARKWRLIYKANKKSIKRASLIRPGQVLVLKRDG